MGMYLISQKNKKIFRFLQNYCMIMLFDNIHAKYKKEKKNEFYCFVKSLAKYVTFTSGFY